MSRSLRDRLAQFDRDRPATGPLPTRPPQSAALQGLLERGARWVGSPPTGYLLLEETLDDHPGAPRSVVAPSTWSLLSGREAPSEGPWGIIDTETTGLESGTGSIIFLVGILLWDESEMRLLQYFLPEPAGEPELFAAVIDELDGLTGLISYNGASFDLPRLRNRFRLSRLPVDSLDRPHLDLLHPSRRLFRELLSECRQPRVEELLLGLDRGEDLPGSEAPAVYQALLHEGEDRGLARVCEHNRLDLIGLLGIAYRLGEFLGDPLGVGGEFAPEARLAAAKLLAERGDAALGSSLLDRLIEGSDEPVLDRALWLRAHLHRQASRPELAHDDFLRLVQRSPSRIRAWEEKAKLEEHRLGRIGDALESTRRALRQLDAQCEFLGEARQSQALHEALLHRQRRLERKRMRKNG